METNEAIMGKDGMIHFQQCDYKDEVIIEVPDSSPVINQFEKSTFNLSTGISTDQPIDLSICKPPAAPTTSISNQICNKSFPQAQSQPLRILIHPKNDSLNFSTRNLEANTVQHRGEHFTAQTSSSNQIIQAKPCTISSQYNNLPLQHPKPAIRRPRCRNQSLPPKHVSNLEILNMAKSIFYKRTCTLYQWMYPGASREQVRLFVTTTWQNMTGQEKNIYIMQGMERCNKNNTTGSPMVNPQLSQIKYFPSMPHQVPPPRCSRKTNELQNAISSISNDFLCVDNLQVESLLPPDDPTKPPFQKKRRLTNKKLSQNLSSASQEFRDDPELSEELAQFSFLFKHEV